MARWCRQQEQHSDHRKSRSVSSQGAEFCFWASVKVVEPATGRVSQIQGKGFSSWFNLRLAAG